MYGCSRLFCQWWSNEWKRLVNPYRVLNGMHIAQRVGVDLFILPWWTWKLVCQDDTFIYLITDDSVFDFSILSDSLFRIKLENSVNSSIINLFFYNWQVLSSIFWSELRNRVVQIPDICSMPVNHSNDPENNIDFQSRINFTAEVFNWQAFFPPTYIDCLNLHNGVVCGKPARILDPVS